MTGAEARLHSVELEASSLDQQLREHEKSAAARNSHLEGLGRDLERAAQHVRVGRSRDGADGGGASRTRATH